MLFSYPLIDVKSAARSVVYSSPVYGLFHNETSEDWGSSNYVAGVLRTLTTFYLANRTSRS